jgi:hypothetical protein
MPSHFPYTTVFIDDLANQSRVYDRFRFWATYIKIRQQQTNGFYAVENGLDLRTAQAHLTKLGFPPVDGDTIRCAGTTRFLEVPASLSHPWVRCFSHFCARRRSGARV